MVVCDDDDGTSTLCLTFFLFPFQETGWSVWITLLRYRLVHNDFLCRKYGAWKKHLKKDKYPWAWMVLVIIGILCLYYYRGMGSRLQWTRTGTEWKKESAYTTLGRDLGASGTTSITGKPDSRIIDRHKAGETNHLGKHLYSAESILFLAKSRLLSVNCLCHQYHY